MSEVSEPLPDLIMKLVRKPDVRRFAFAVGSTIRVKNGVSRDGQTPAAWNGAKAEVLSRRATLFTKTHTYRLRHLLTGEIDSFEDCEIDRRFARPESEAEFTDRTTVPQPSEQ